MKSLFRQAFGLGEADFCHAPEAFNAIDAGGPTGEFIAAMVDTKMIIAKIDWTIIATPAIGVDDAGVYLPRIMPCNIGFEQPGTISV